MLIINNVRTSQRKYSKPPQVKDTEAISITNFTSSQALSRYAIVLLRRYGAPSRVATAVKLI